MSDHVTTTTANGCRTITLNRPEKANALTWEMIDDLTAVVSREPSADERVMVVRSTGRTFCAGVDLQGISASAPRTPSPIIGLLQAMDESPLPIVGVVQGDAIAGGAQIALHCDLVVATDRARLGMSLVQLGLVPVWEVAATVLDRMGPALAKEVLLVGNPIAATRLADVGVIARAVPEAELEATVAGFVDRLLANASRSLAVAKATLARQMELRGLLERSDIDTMIKDARRRTGAKRGVDAWIEGTTPDFGEG